MNPSNEPSPDLVSFELPAVEGEEIRLDAQTIKPANGPKRYRGLGPAFAFKAMGSARAVIVKESSKAAVIKSSLRAGGNEIAGSKVNAYAVDFDLLEKGGEARSGRHTRQTQLLTSGAYAVLLASSCGKVLSNDPKTILLVNAELPAKLQA